MPNFNKSRFAAAATLQDESDDASESNVDATESSNDRLNLKPISSGHHRSPIQKQSSKSIAKFPNISEGNITLSQKGSSKYTGSFKGSNSKEGSGSQGEQNTPS